MYSLNSSSLLYFSALLAPRDDERPPKAARLVLDRRKGALCMLKHLAATKTSAFDVLWLRGRAPQFSPTRVQASRNGQNFLPACSLTHASASNKHERSQSQVITPAQILKNQLQLPSSFLDKEKPYHSSLHRELDSSSNTRVGACAQPRYR